jgi:transposase-like protein
MGATDLRQERGRQLLTRAWGIQRIDDREYKVDSQCSNRVYDVVRGQSGWACSCPDHSYRGIECKHSWAVELSIALREKVASHVVLAPIQIHTCPICNSQQIVRHGIRHNSSGDIQRYVCASCGRWFVVNLGFERMKASPQVITSAMQLYGSRASFSLLGGFHPP